jgi:hypothetical protein
MPHLRAVGEKVEGAEEGKNWWGCGMGVPVVQVARSRCGEEEAAAVPPTSAVTLHQRKARSKEAARKGRPWPETAKAGTGPSIVGDVVGRFCKPSYGSCCCRGGRGRPSCEESGAEGRPCKATLSRRNRRIIQIFFFFFTSTSGGMGWKKKRMNA